MFRALIALSFVIAACGGGETGDDTFGTIGTTAATTVASTTTTTIREAAALEELVIAISDMPEGWVLVDDMSGTVALGAIHASLLEGVDTAELLSAYRTTFARSTTSEIGALARSGAELIVSIALEMDDSEAASTGVETIEDTVSDLVVSRQTIRTPGEGIRVELGGGIFLMAWSVDEIIQVLVANGVPGTNIVNIADLVPDVK